MPGLADGALTTQTPFCVLKKATTQWLKLDSGGMLPNSEMSHHQTVSSRFLIAWGHMMEMSLSLQQLHNHIAKDRITPAHKRMWLPWKSVYSTLNSLSSELSMMTQFWGSVRRTIYHTIVPSKLALASNYLGSQLITFLLSLHFQHKDLKKLINFTLEIFFFNVREISRHSIDNWLNCLKIFILIWVETKTWKSPVCVDGVWTHRYMRSCRKLLREEGSQELICKENQHMRDGQRTERNQGITRRKQDCDVSMDEDGKNVFGKREWPTVWLLCANAFIQQIIIEYLWSAETVLSTRNSIENKTDKVLPLVEYVTQCKFIQIK